MRILFLGDVVGKSGCEAITNNLPKQLEKRKIDFVIANGENAADNGFGITKKITNDLFQAGKKAILTEAKGNPKALAKIYREVEAAGGDKTTMSKLNEITKIIREIMISVESSDHHKFTVPLLIDLNSGENWGMLH